MCSNEKPPPTKCDPRLRNEYDHIKLCPEEIEAAILEGKKKKYFHDKHKDFWIEIENKKV